MHKITNELGKRINLVGREFSLISSWGYGDLNFDAVFKWANIIHEFHSYFGKSPKGLNILDVGGGLGPLDLYFTNFGRVVNIDLSHESTWFPTNKKGLLVGAVGPKYKSKNLNRINGNFVSVAQTLKEEFDFIYDSCSMIHFQRSVRQEKINLNYKEMDESIIMFARTISNLMTNKSLFVSATDMAHPYSIEFKEIISQDRILNSFKNENFSVSIILGEHSYVLKRKWRRKTIPKTNRATDLLQKSDLQEYLSTWWPQGSVVRARTLVGVFSFAKISTKTPRVRISKKLIIKE